MSMVHTGTLQLSSDQPTETRGGNTSTLTRAAFPAPFLAGAKVVVLARTQPFNGPETPGIRVHGVTPEGFLIRFNEINAGADMRSDGPHTTETVGWIAATV